MSSVYHAGGVLADATVGKQRLQGITAVMGAKVAALAKAVRFSHGSPITGLHLFSSVSAVTGNAGQANYAAANAVLISASHVIQVGIGHYLWKFK